jgi:hypothetical protein
MALAMPAESPQAIAPVSAPGVSRRKECGFRLSVDVQDLRHFSRPAFSEGIRASPSSSLCDLAPEWIINSPPLHVLMLPGEPLISTLLPSPTPRKPEKPRPPCQHKRTCFVWPSSSIAPLFPRDALAVTLLPPTSGSLRSERRKIAAGMIDWRANAKPEDLVVESWGQGFVVGALIIMACVTVANMRRRVLL